MIEHLIVFEERNVRWIHLGAKLDCSEGFNDDKKLGYIDEMINGFTEGWSLGINEGKPDGKNAGNNDGTEDGSNVRLELRGTGKAKVSKVSAPPLISQPFYSWDPLQLGTSLGTVALNYYLKNTSTKPQVFVGFQNKHEYSPQGVLQIFDTIRAKTYLPSRSSFLQKVVQLPTEEGGSWSKRDAMHNSHSLRWKVGFFFLENSTFRLDLQEEEIMQRSDQVQNSLSKWKIDAIPRSPKTSVSIEDDDTSEYCYEGDTDNEVDF